MIKIIVKLSLLLSEFKRISAEKCAQFGALLSRVVPVDGSVIALLIGGIDPAFTYVNPDITDGHFPSTQGSSPDGGELEHYGRNVSSDEVLADLKARNRRTATAAEGLRHWQKNPECREFWVVALGQVWNGQALVLFESLGGRVADLRRVADVWDAGYRFLSFPL